MTVNNRFKAFAIHLLISLIIFGALLAVILICWFPNGLVFAGGLQGLKLIVGVDIVLGPLLTLVVYRQGKPGLKLDLTLIATLQIVCLVIGTYIVHNERPMATIVMDDGVQFITYGDTQNHDLKLDRFPGKFPKSIMLDLPDDPETWEPIRFASELADAKPFIFRSDLYISLADVSKERFQKRLEGILSQHAMDPVERDDLPTQQNCAWIPIQSIHFVGYACISQDDGIEKLSNHQVL